LNAAIIKKSQCERSARKPLDKPLKMWYNKSVKRAERERGKRPVIRLSLGVIKEPRAEKNFSKKFEKPS